MSQKIAKEVTLVLIGSSGNGKSATGNSIIGKSVFKTAAGTTSKTTSCVMESCIIGDIKVNVVDVPGVQIDNSSENVLDTFIESLEQALRLCNYKFTALALVLKYGQRFTKQESDVIKFVKGILGKNVLCDFGVCVLTYGDNFEQDEENDSFENWCKHQEHEIKALFTECNYRCVLFNNRQKDSNLRVEQVNMLLTSISKEKEYSEVVYRDAKKELPKLILETKAPVIRQKIGDFIQNTRKAITNIQTYLNIDKQLQEYNNTLTDVNLFETKLIKEYGDPENLKEHLSMLKILEMELVSKIKDCEISQKTKQEATPQNSNYSLLSGAHFDSEREGYMNADSSCLLHSGDDNHRIIRNEGNGDDETFYQKMMRLFLAIFNYFISLFFDR